jgi:uncharacterized delta-60 repeat protein
MARQRVGTLAPPARSVHVSCAYRAVCGLWLVVWLALGTPATAAIASPGDLDASFGRGGVRIGPQGELEALARRSDGTLVAAGGHALARYHRDGRLDRSFAHGGAQVVRSASVSALALQPDGRIVVAGSAPAGTGHIALAVMRYRRDGGRDRSFARGGLETTRTGRDGRLFAIALQPNGRIVAAGFIQTGNRDRFVVARYRRDGRLDRSFSDDGLQITAIGERAIAFDAALQRDGKIVLAGMTETAGGLRFALARYLRNGRLDPSFGAGGVALGPAGYAAAAVIQPDGDIVAAGTAHGDFALTRYRPDGRLDPAFSDDGIQTTAISAVGGEDLALALVLAGDGTLVAAGRTQTQVYPVDDLSGDDFALARYLPDGRLDRSFATDGVQTTHFGSGGAEAHALVQQPGNGLVAGGVAQDPGGGQMRFALARYKAA